LLATGEAAPILPLFVVLASILVLGVQRLNVPELVELRHIIGRGFQQRSVIAHNLRMQAAADALDRAQEPTAVLEALELAFEGSEFSRLELWLPEPLGLGLAMAGNGRVARDGMGYRLNMELGELHPAHEIEIRVPVLVGEERVGRLSLFRDATGERVFTDLRLLPTVVVPALVAALVRCEPKANGAPARQDREEVAASRTIEEGAA